VASKARFAERAQQIAQRFEAEEVEALVGDFELGLLGVFADLSAYAGLDAKDRGGWSMGDVIFLLHALDQFFDQFVELAISRHLLASVRAFFVEHLAVHQCCSMARLRSSRVCSPSGISYHMSL
jgi:hypothetical protein